MEPDLECPICLTSIFTGPCITVGCCNKQFHTTCYTKCMVEKLICPMCRANQSNCTETRITVNPIVIIPDQITLIQQDPSTKCLYFIVKLACGIIIAAMFVLTAELRHQ